MVTIADTVPSTMEHHGSTMSIVIISIVHVYSVSLSPRMTQQKVTMVMSSYNNGQL